MSFKGSVKFVLFGLVRSVVFSEIFGGSSFFLVSRIDLTPSLLKIGVISCEFSVVVSECFHASSGFFDVSFNIFDQLVVSVLFVG